MAGYSGTPLQKKLGFVPGQRVAFANPPDDLDRLLGPLPDGVRIADAEVEIDLALLFVKRLEALREDFGTLAERLAPAGRLWVAWPKKASREPPRWHRRNGGPFTRVWHPRPE